MQNQPALALMLTAKFHPGRLGLHYELQAVGIPLIAIKHAELYTKTR